MLFYQEGKKKRFFYVHRMENSNNFEQTLLEQQREEKNGQNSSISSPHIPVKVMHINEISSHYLVSAFFFLCNTYLMPIFFSPMCQTLCVHRCVFFASHVQCISQISKCNLLSANIKSFFKYFFFRTKSPNRL